jgi:hypothetical protein
MVAKLLPLLLLCACATTSELSAPDQSALARLAAPYGNQLRAIGITRITSPGNGTMVRLDTAYGAVYVDYPKGLGALAFVLEIDADDVKAKSAAIDEVQDRRVLAALMPDVVRATEVNNRFGWIRANPMN